MRYSIIYIYIHGTHTHIYMYIYILMGTCFIFVHDIYIDNIRYGIYIYIHRYIYIYSICNMYHPQQFSGILDNILGLYGTIYLQCMRYTYLISLFLVMGDPQVTMVVSILIQGLMTWMISGYLRVRKPPYGVLLGYYIYIYIQIIYIHDVGYSRILTLDNTWDLSIYIDIYI